MLHSFFYIAKIQEMRHSLFYILQQILQAQRNDALIILHSTTVIAKIKEMLQSLQLYNLPCYLTKGYEKWTTLSFLHNVFCPFVGKQFCLGQSAV